MMASVLVLHGPNLNLLGERETAWYGKQPLSTINEALLHTAKSLKLTLTTQQFNAEAALIDAIHHANTDIIIFNPAAYTHTSIALRDALLAVGTPFIEVHLSNIDAREAFRATSYFSDIALGVISGFGEQSYQLALHAAHHYLTKEDKSNGR